MADSEDEYDRKRRDKFRGERSSGGGDNFRPERRDDRRPGLGGGGGRDDWGERNPFRGGAGARPRPDYREYRGPRDRYGSPPPTKRMRPDWGEDLRSNPRYGGYEAYMMHAWNEHYASHNMHSNYGHSAASHARDVISNNDMPTQPAMLTLKQYLDTQDDGISDAEVLRKYTEYKLEFKRQQLNEFFVTHKDEEWFKNKYHPAESVNRKEEQLAFLKRRVEVFNEVLEQGLVKQVTVDTNQTEPLLRLLDTVVIKLEGGNDDDLKVLDEKPKEIIPIEKKPDPEDNDVIITAVTIRKDDREDRVEVVSPRPVETAGDSEAENWDDDEPAEPAVVKVESEEEKIKDNEEKNVKKKLKRKRKDSNSSTSSSTASSSSSSSASDDEDEKMGDKYDLDRVKDEPKEEDKNEIVEEAEKSTGNNENKDEETNEEKSENGEETEKNGVDSKNDENEKSDIIENTDVEEKEEKKEEEQIETIDLDKEKDVPQPRALHRTSSIFLRNLAPSITKAEIENICKSFDGYLRVAIADPLLERRWFRRGWVTFKRDVNIKEICWNLNNARVRDCEMGAIVNRDLSRRVRPVNGMTAHKTIVRADIKLCAKIAMMIDEKFKLWDNHVNKDGKENGNQESNPLSFGIKSHNPVLQNITDFLIEEASAEEEELLGISNEKEKEAEGEIVERDSQLISVLDSMILYLRIVHSVDFYNHCEYPYEDEMPNRCGIIHARGPAPTKVSTNDIQDYIKSFENKMQPFLTKTTTVDDEELKNLGAKDAEAEVEKFIQSNTQELAKDKWLCPLSGKKFKGPEFIRKHIFNKHGEKVDEVRKEVEYYNNYLKDPKRPQLPEHKRTTSESSSAPNSGYRGPMYPPGYGMPYSGYVPPMMMPPRGGRGFGGPGGMRRDLPIEPQRRLIGYHDLDSPANFDIFD